MGRKCTSSCTAGLDDNLRRYFFKPMKESQYKKGGIEGVGKRMTDELMMMMGRRGVEEEMLEKKVLVVFVLE